MKSTVISGAITREQRQQVRKRCDERGISESQYVRQLIEKDLNDKSTYFTRVEERFNMALQYEMLELMYFMSLAEVEKIDKTKKEAILEKAKQRFNDFTKTVYQGVLQKLSIERANDLQEKDLNALARPLDEKEKLIILRKASNEKIIELTIWNNTEARKYIAELEERNRQKEQESPLTKEELTFINKYGTDAALEAVVQKRYAKARAYIQQKKNELTRNGETN